MAPQFEEKEALVEEFIRPGKHEPDKPKAPIVHMDPEQIQGHLTEAEVYLKYGLTNKAIEQLEAILAGDPENLAAHIQLREIYKSENEIAKAVQECLALAEIYKKTADKSQEQAMVDEVIKLDPKSQFAQDELSRRE